MMWRVGATGSIRLSSLLIKWQTIIRNRVEERIEHLCILLRLISQQSPVVLARKKISLPQQQTHFSPNDQNRQLFTLGASRYLWAIYNSPISDHKA